MLFIFSFKNYIYFEYTTIHLHPMLLSEQIQLQSNIRRCHANNMTMTIYDGTTLPEDAKSETALCSPKKNEFQLTSFTNRVFIRLNGNNIPMHPNLRLAQPEIRLVYSLVREGGSSNIL